MAGHWKAAGAARGRRWIGFALVLVAACASVETEVAVQRTFCCGGDESGYRSFTVDATSVPAFLRPYFAEELARVLVSKGLTETEPAELTVTLRYAGRSLDGASPVYITDDAGEEVRTPGSEPRDTFQGAIGAETADRFMARMVMEIRVTDSGALVFSGVLSRVHRVSTGEYMHERARIAIHLAFQRLLEGFPRAPAADLG